MLDIPILMISLWEERRSLVELRESTMLTSWLNELRSVAFLLILSRGTSTVSDSEPILMGVVESDWKEWLCCIAISETSGTQVYFQEIPKESLLEIIQFNQYNIKISVWIGICACRIACWVFQGECWCWWGVGCWHLYPSPCRRWSSCSASSENTPPRTSPSFPD